jgi:hypothetical protein
VERFGEVCERPCCVGNCVPGQICWVCEKWVLKREKERDEKEVFGTQCKSHRPREHRWNLLDPRAVLKKGGGSRPPTCADDTRPSVVRDEIIGLNPHAVSLHGTSSKFQSFVREARANNLFYLLISLSVLQM